MSELGYRKYGRFTMFTYRSPVTSGLFYAQTLRHRFAKVYRRLPGAIISFFYAPGIKIRLIGGPEMMVGDTGIEPVTPAV